MKNNTNLMFLLAMCAAVILSAPSSTLAQESETKPNKQVQEKGKEKKDKKQKAAERKQKQTKEIAAIKAVIQGQADAWNKGDLEGYMSGYWKSKNLSFSSGGKTTKGWKQTLEGYRSRYNPPAGMGKLKFDGLEVQLLSGRIALVLGKWHLTMDDGSTPNGNFSLVFRKMKGKWLVIHDHTSSLKKPTKK